MPYGKLGEVKIGNKVYLSCYQKDCISSRSVSVHSYLSCDAFFAHRRGRGDKTNIGHFLLVTTRSIAHSGRLVCIPNCVGEFGMDTGQPLVYNQQRNVKLPE